MRLSWRFRFMALAEQVAEWSKDRSTKVGCVITTADKRIVSLGYNGFPRGVDDDRDDRHDRPAKYLWTEHAERNAIYNAVSQGINLSGCTLYSTMFPCADCARGIIQSGMNTLVSPPPAIDRWDDSHKAAEEMLREAGVTILILPKQQEQGESTNDSND